MSRLEVSEEYMNQTEHYPVMYREILKMLDIPNSGVVVDCTLGVGSLALKCLQSMKSGALYIGIDRDQDSLNIAADKLKDHQGKFKLVQENFANISHVLSGQGIKEADAIIFDLGISTYQLSNQERGFSFLKDSPLDMRMDRNSFVSAYDLVNNLSESELDGIFRKFGEERFSRKIASAIVSARSIEPVATTSRLAEVVSSSVGPRYRFGRIHPATRVFQALRIAVNRELEALKIGVDNAVPLLSKGGKIGVISFHSLEDRIVKYAFKDYASTNMLKIITKKPLLPGNEEIGENNPSRSAKLRVAERM
jgi:16S rRNA (cytosine1402-N4)-methyltransferase